MKSNAFLRKYSLDSEAAPGIPPYRYTCLLAPGEAAELPALSVEYDRWTAMFDFGGGDVWVSADSPVELPTTSTFELSDSESRPTIRDYARSTVLHFLNADTKPLKVCISLYPYING